MKIVVIGLGSMGKRRLRLLSERKDVELFGIDSQESRCEEVREKFGITCFKGITEALETENVEAAVISTSPLSHTAIIKECLTHNLHVFTEINLVQDGYEENMALAKEKDLVLFLSSTFLYRKETQKIIEKVQNAKCPLNYIYHVGQYLPDWHPWESYNSYFIGNPRTNGCREIMAIDLPWIVSAFGPIKSISSIKSKNTELNITYNDNYLITIEHESGHKGVFAVDVVARKSGRNIEIFGEQLHLSWNGTADSLRIFNIEEKKDEVVSFDDASEHIEGYAAFVTENPYREELNSFLKQITDRDYTPAWTFEKDKVVLDIIDQIEA